MAQYGPARLRTDCGASVDKDQLPEPIGATWTAEHHARAAARSYLSIPLLRNGPRLVASPPMALSGDIYVRLLR